MMYFVGPFPSEIRHRYLLTELSSRLVSDSGHSCNFTLSVNFTTSISLIVYSIAVLINPPKVPLQAQIERRVGYRVFNNTRTSHLYRRA
jgi:hypothetical protein